VGGVRPQNPIIRFDSFSLQSCFDPTQAGRILSKSKSSRSVLSAKRQVSSHNAWHFISAVRLVGQSHPEKPGIKIFCQGNLFRSCSHFPIPSKKLIPAPPDALRVCNVSALGFYRDKSG
jgi:hypothetical protein